MWDIKKARRLLSLKGHGSTVTGVCVDRNNNVYSASADTTAKIWSPYKNNSYNKYLFFFLSFFHFPFSLFSIIIVASILIINYRKCNQVTLTGHLSPLTSIALSDNESKIITASYDKTLRVWDIKGANISTLSAHEGKFTN